MHKKMVKLAENLTGSTTKKQDRPSLHTYRSIRTGERVN